MRCKLDDLPTAPRRQVEAKLAQDAAAKVGASTPLGAQTEALFQMFNGLGYGVSAVSAGKIFDLDVDTDDAAEAKRIGEEAAAKVLSNDLIEGFEVIVG